MWTRGNRPRGLSLQATAGASRFLRADGIFVIGTLHLTVFSRGESRELDSDSGPEDRFPHSWPPTRTTVVDKGSDASRANGLDVLRLVLIPVAKNSTR